MAETVGMESPVGATDVDGPRFPILARIWAGWKAFAHKLGAINTRVILTLVYATIFAISNLGLRLFRKDPLQRRHRPGASQWKSADTPTADDDPIAAHRRQF